ncbi:hypothetical protein EV421DRAFT_1902447 [Armillaria borealis]|uniref:Epidermal growth factor receptor-like transmembrane-juxtamembrane segment domain-containing protein n=1 Tax=Armillaria borealis TaxID=47425 RepID=A0AA39JMH8_9AGAR|nr:hypothetical protein EV421DRAFT_1902447 [Armillaria borealis]
MSPVTLQVVQDSPSGYLTSSGVLDLFWSPLKSRGKRNDPSGNDDTKGCRSGNKDHCMSESGKQSADSTEYGSTGQISQTSSCPTSWPASSPTVTSLTIMSTGATGSGPLVSVPSSSASTSSPSNSSAIPAEGSTNSDSASSHKNTGAIISGIVGGVVLLSIAALILFIFLRRRRRMKHTAPSAEFLHPNSPFQRLNTARSGSPTRTRSVFDMLPSPNSGDAGGKSLLRSLSRRDYKSPPTLEKVTVDTTSAVHAL